MQDDIEFFKVGGCVRDELMGLRTKDIDFTVVIDRPSLTAEEGFNLLLDRLAADGFKVFKSDLPYLTIRAQFPPEMQEQFGGVRDADFVIARKDGPSSDGRRPDWVKLGMLEDDLARRDFTMNAIAQRVDGSLIDPFGGQADIEDGFIRFVGSAYDRIAEDGLRVLRAFRFAVTKNMKFATSTRLALHDHVLPAKMLHSVAEEKIAIELEKMFMRDTIASMELLSQLPLQTQEAIFRGEVKLTATMKKGRS